MTDISILEYMAEAGSRYTKDDAQKIGPVLSELAENGAVTPRDVVDAAKSKNSPLNSYFEWNDRKAADLYRMEQARNMLRSIRIRYSEAGNEKTARAFQVLSKSAYENSPREYRSFKVLHGDSAFAVQMMVSAFDDLQSWRRKYESYADMWTTFGDAFQAVINQIAEWTDEASAQDLPANTDGALEKLIEWRDQYQSELETWTACREHMAYMIEAIAEAETSFLRLKIGARNCMSCGSQFVSGGIHQRLCTRCSAKGDGISEANIPAA